MSKGRDSSPRFNFADRSSSAPRPIDDRSDPGSYRRDPVLPQLPKETEKQISPLLENGEDSARDSRAENRVPKIEPPASLTENPVNVGEDPVFSTQESQEEGSQTLTEEAFRALMAAPGEPSSPPPLPLHGTAVPPLPPSRSWIWWLVWIGLLAVLTMVVLFTKSSWLPWITPRPADPIAVRPPVTVPTPVLAPQGDSSGSRPEWMYYVQIYASRDQYSANKVANTFRSAGVSVRLESEFVPKSRRTFYKVRIGPTMARDSARMIRDTIRHRGYADAFLDSLRSEEGDTAASALPRSLPALPSTRALPNKISSTRGKGFAIKVVATRDGVAAKQLATKLVRQGFPAYLVSTGEGNARWNRVFVGPFAVRKEAEEYKRLVDAVTGAGAYIVDLSKE